MRHQLLKLGVGIGAAAAFAVLGCSGDRVAVPRTASVRSDALATTAAATIHMRGPHGKRLDYTLVGTDLIIGPGQTAHVTPAIAGKLRALSARYDQIEQEIAAARPLFKKHNLPDPDSLDYAAIRMQVKHLVSKARMNLSRAGMDSVVRLATNAQLVAAGQKPLRDFASEGMDCDSALGRFYGDVEQYNYWYGSSVDFTYDVYANCGGLTDDPAQKAADRASGACQESLSLEDNALNQTLLFQSAMSDAWNYVTVLCLIL